MPLNFIPRTTRVVGILNVTPDSFSDGGQWRDPEKAAERAVRMAEEGAALIDIGGQSTRPGHVEVTAAEEIARVVPVVARLAVSHPQLLLSIDTYRPEVARTALGAGGRWLNDIHGFQGDPAMAAVAADFGCPVVLMHHDRRFSTAAGDTMERIKSYFDRSLKIAAAAGVPADHLVLDPGVGFFKTPDQSLEVVARIAELKSFGLPLLLGISRKSVIGHIVGGTPQDRLEGTLAATVLAVAQGVDFVRVHDVLANVRAIKMASAILEKRRPQPGE